MFSVHYIEQIFTEYISRNSICKRLTLHCISLIQIVPYKPTQPLLPVTITKHYWCFKEEGWQEVVSVRFFFNLGKKEKSRAYSKRIAGFLSIGLVLWGLWVLWGQSIPSTLLALLLQKVEYIMWHAWTWQLCSHNTWSHKRFLTCFACGSSHAKHSENIQKPQHQPPTSACRQSCWPILKNIALKQWTTWSKS